MWDLRHFPHFSTADQTTSPSMNFKYEILGPVAVCHSCPKMCPAETLFFRGRFKHQLETIYVSPIPSALSQCECAFACMDHWTKFRILTCKCLTLGAPSSNTLIPLVLLALVALCPLYLLYLLFLSLTLTFK